MSLPPVYVGVRGRWLAALVGSGLLQAASAIAGAMLIQRALDAVLGDASGPGSLVFLSGMLAAGVVGGAARWLERYLAERLGQDYVHELRLQMFATLARRSPENRARNGRGAVPLRFISDLNALSHWISFGQARLIVAALLLIATLGYVATLHIMTAVVVALLFGVNAFASILLGRRLETAVIESRRRRGSLASFTAEKVASMATIVAFGRLSGEASRLRRASEHLVKAMNERAFWVGSLRAVGELAIRAMIAVVIVFGVVQLQRGEISSGALLAAVSLVALMVTPLRDLGRVYEYWKAGKVARDKLSGFIDKGAIENDKRTRRIRRFRGELAIADLKLHATIEETFSAEIKPGTKLLITGANGVGKTTLLWVLAGIRRGVAGTVCIDGEPVHRLDQRSLQGSIGIASPDLPLLRGSLRRNLRYRVPGTTKQSLIDICARVGLDASAAIPSMLLDLPIQECGANLSDGQRARVQLARALLGHPAILLLDELDAHLDATGRAMLRDVIRDFPGTVIFTTHDPETAALAERQWLVGNQGICCCDPRSGPVVTLSQVRGGRQ